MSDNNSPSLPVDNEQIELQAVYANIYNEIVKPDKVFVATQYFRQKWVPRLNANLAWLIIALRQHSYWNKGTNELRDWCIIDQDELAQEIGVTVKSLRRLLKMEYADQFIVEVKKRYRYDQKLGKRVREKSRYRVRMDDPLTPEDRELFKQRIAGEMAGLNIDPETGQMDMLKLLDRPLSDMPNHLQDKMTGRSQKKSSAAPNGEQNEDVHLQDKMTGRSEEKLSTTSNGEQNEQTRLPDKMTGRSQKPQKNTTKPCDLPDKMTGILYTGQNDRNTDSTIIVQQQKDVVDLMKNFGIIEPALSKFKEHPVEQISGWIEYAKENELGPGFVVARLTADEWPPALPKLPDTTELTKACEAARQEAEAERLAALEAAGVSQEHLIAWDAVLAQLSLQMAKATFDTWLKDTEPLRSEDDLLVIGVKNGYAVDWLDNRLRDTIDRVAVGAGLTVPLRFEAKDAQQPAELS